MPGDDGFMDLFEVIVLAIPDEADEEDGVTITATATLNAKFITLVGMLGILHKRLDVNPPSKIPPPDARQGKRPFIIPAKKSRVSCGHVAHRDTVPRWRLSEGPEECAIAKDAEGVDLHVRHRGYQHPRCKKRIPGSFWQASRSRDHGGDPKAMEKPWSIVRKRHKDLSRRVSVG
ncbi:hypothetical protein IMZ48_11345 [Candidatus Bathyarchaeota archaeon]|nr:hypothetical protein [Candidatus Bathyarchaeota archaeon]